MIGPCSIALWADFTWVQCLCSWSRVHTKTLLCRQTAGSSGTCNGAAWCGSSQCWRGSGQGSGSGCQGMGRGCSKVLWGDSAEVRLVQLRVLPAKQRRLPLLQAAQILRLHHDPVLAICCDSPRCPHGCGKPAQNQHHGAQTMTLTPFTTLPVHYLKGSRQRLNHCAHAVRVSSPATIQRSWRTLCMSMANSLRCTAS